MTKKKVILLVVAALFAVSGLTALPSGNITGGVGCMRLFWTEKEKRRKRERKQNASACRCIWWQNFRYNQNESSRRDVQ